MKRLLPLTLLVFFLTTVLVEAQQNQQEVQQARPISEKELNFASKMIEAWTANLDAWQKLLKPYGSRAGRLPARTVALKPHVANLQPQDYSSQKYQDVETQMRKLENDIGEFVHSTTISVPARGAGSLGPAAGDPARVFQNPRLRARGMFEYSFDADSGKFHANPMNAVGPDGARRTRSVAPFDSIQRQRSPERPLQRRR